MKNSKHLLIILLVELLFFCAVKAQNTLNTPITDATFQVCDVQKAKSTIYALQDSLMEYEEMVISKTYQEVVIHKTITERNREDRVAAIEKDTSLNDEQKWILLNDMSYQPVNIPVRKMEAATKKNEQLIQTNFHAFMATMHLAYAHHYPMTISPDMIWLLITQGFAVHINQNAEKMRHSFVDFKGKKNINIKRNRFIKGDQNNDWPGTFEEFSKEIEANTGAKLLELVTGDFSTTGPIEKAAFQITLMDAMKSYFTYSVTTFCGIPEITLEGTSEDWKKIESKAQELAQYDLEWWIDDLLPILKEFTKASSGQTDKYFWESIYKWKTQGSGSAYITGWILNFFPYKEVNGSFVQVKKETPRRTNYIDDHSQKNTTPKITYNLKATTGELTSGLSQAGFIWNYYGTYYKMEFVAGFVGCQQNPTTLSLRPEISWAVIDKQMKPKEEELETYWKGGNKEYLKHKH